MITSTTDDPGIFRDTVVERVRRGARLATMVALGDVRPSRLLVATALGPVLSCDELRLNGSPTYRSLTPDVASAAWYERELSDLFHLHSDDGRSLEPLTLPQSDETRLAPSHWRSSNALVTLTPVPGGLVVGGEGLFTIPYGPVRSGIFESIEYDVETSGEEIPHVRVRPFYKHRGVEVSFQSLSPLDGTLLAERVEGVASVAHALAFCQALETIAGTSVPARAGLWRVVHAELERVAAHLDTFLRLNEAAGQAVAIARFATHKERVLRLRGDLCGSRFGRGVVVPGGVRPFVAPEHAFDGIVSDLQVEIHRDLRLLLDTPSFVDRLRTTGILSSGDALDGGALGPVGRASGVGVDTRRERPYGAYVELATPDLRRHEGDALARQLVRVSELEHSFELIRHCLGTLETAGQNGALDFATPLSPLEGEAFGWTEAPQGEVLYFVRVEGDRLCRVKPRSASFHNFALFENAFPHDVLTDFAFIEGSFGLSAAGGAG